MGAHQMVDGTESDQLRRLRLRDLHGGHRKNATQRDKRVLGGLAGVGAVLALSLAGCGTPGPSASAQGSSTGAPVVSVGVSDVLLLHAPTSFVGANTPWTIRASLVCSIDKEGGEAPQKSVEQSRCAGMDITVVGGAVGDPGGQKVLWQGSEASLSYQVDGPELEAGQTYRYHFEAATPGGLPLRVPADGEFSTSSVSETASDVSTLDAKIATPARSVTLPFSEDPGGLGAAFVKEAYPSAPSGFSITDNGTIQVVDWMNSRVATYQPDGKYLGALPGLDQPSDIASMSDSSAVLVPLGTGGGAVSYTSEDSKEPVFVSTLSGVTVRVRASNGIGWVETDPGQWLRIDTTRPTGTAEGDLPVGGDNDQAMLLTAEVGSQARFAVQGAKSGTSTVVALDGVTFGGIQLTERTADGGTVIGFAVSSGDSEWLMVLVEDANGSLVRTLRLPLQTIYLSSTSSGIRWDPATQQIAVVTDMTETGMTIEWFDL